MLRNRGDAPGRDTSTVTISREVAGRVKVIAAQRGITMLEAIDRYAGPAITREYRKVLGELQAAELGGES